VKVVRDYAAYQAWSERVPRYPDLPAQTWVRLLPPELKGLEGRVLWKDGSSTSYAVFIPYGAEGALIYVHRADVEPLGETEEPEDRFPIDRIANDIVTQHLGTLSLVDLKKLIARTWADYEQLPEREQLNVLRDVARKIYGGS